MTLSKKTHTKIQKHTIFCLCNIMKFEMINHFCSRLNNETTSENIISYRIWNTYLKKYNSRSDNCFLWWIFNILVLFNVFCFVLFLHIITPLKLAFEKYESYSRNRKQPNFKFEAFYLIIFLLKFFYLD